MPVFATALSPQVEFFLCFKRKAKAQQPQGMWQGALWGSGDRGSSGEWHREHQEVQVSLVQIISFSLWSGSTLKIGRKLGKR